ncbi:MAG: DUF3034 family protein [Terracidiphilus sp.]|nr:DUF3034 family protein [Terracidiphilus sp.]
MGQRTAFYGAKPVNFRSSSFLSVCIYLTLGAAVPLVAQHLTLEGQTGGFITPTAYVVYTEKGHAFSHPTVGYHMINTTKVIGRIQTFNITEGFANRAEAGYSRSYHTLGESNVASQGAFSQLWNYDGMNIFHGKVVAVTEGQFGPAMPAIAVGGLIRTGDHFVSGHLNKSLGLGEDKAYTNGDVYVVATKMRLKPPVPFMINFGWKATNATIFGLGGQSTRFGGRIFGGLGIPLPGPWKTAIVPSAGFTQEPKTAVNMKYIMPGGVHLPTTMDYAVRITQAEHPHFSFDIGVGQVAGNVGTAVLPTGLPSPYPATLSLPVNLQARKVLGMGLSYRY